MGNRRYSFLAFASCVLNLPWIVSLGWCFWVIGTADGIVAGEIFLLPLTVWFCTGIPAGLCGLVAWAIIRSSPSNLLGQWLALLGMLLTVAVVPTLAIATNVWGTIQQNRINHECTDAPK